MNENMHKILVVDDEKSNIYLFKGILETQNYKVYTAQNAMDGSKILEEEKIDCILLDIMMPEITGIDFLDELMEHPENKNIPVIMVSAKTNENDVSEALDRGAMDYIKKPVSEVELLARLRSALLIKNREEKLRMLLDQNKEIVSIISHDLRSPFTSIVGFSQYLLSDETLSDEQKYYIEFIFKNSVSQLDYLDKLLNMVQLESGKLELVLEQVNLKELLEESLKIFGIKIESKNIDLEVKISENLKVNVDKTLFSQAINNLIGNAVKFTRDSGKIKINCYIKNGTTIISITDNGIGIKEKDKPKIFEKFEKFYSSEIKNEKGTGLGLSNCKKILDAHNIEISFESEEGKGTTFTIII